VVGMGLRALSCQQAERSQRFALPMHNAFLMC